MQSKTLYTLYYLTLTLVAVTAAVTTLTRAGASVFVSQQFHHLEQDKRAMVQHKQALTLAVAQSVSLAQIQQQAQLQGFEPIQGAIAFSETTAMAAR